MYTTRLGASGSNWTAAAPQAGSSLPQPPLPLVPISSGRRCSRLTFVSTCTGLRPCRIPAPPPASCSATIRSVPGRVWIKHSVTCGAPAVPTWALRVCGQLMAASSWRSAHPPFPPACAHLLPAACDSSLSLLNERQTTPSPSSLLAVESAAKHLARRDLVRLRDITRPPGSASAGKSRAPPSSALGAPLSPQPPTSSPCDCLEAFEIASAAIVSSHQRLRRRAAATACSALHPHGSPTLLLCHRRDEMAAPAAGPQASGPPALPPPQAPTVAAAAQHGQHALVALLAAVRERVAAGKRKLAEADAQLQARLRLAMLAGWLLHVGGRSPRGRSPACTCPRLPNHPCRSWPSACTPCTEKWMLQSRRSNRYWRRWAAPPTARCRCHRVGAHGGACRVLHCLAGLALPPMSQLLRR